MEAGIDRSIVTAGGAHCRPFSSESRRRSVGGHVLLYLEAAVMEPATRRKQNPKQVALLPANALSSHRIVPPLRPVSFRLVPFLSPLEGHTGGTCGGTFTARGVPGAPTQTEPHPLPWRLCSGRETAATSHPQERAEEGERGAPGNCEAGNEEGATKGPSCSVACSGETAPGASALIARY